jgi:hypothetical protein
MSNEIRFPDEMTIRSPQIEALRVIAKEMSEFVHKDLTEANKKLVALEKLPKLIEHVQETVVEQFLLQLQSQFETQMLAREASIQVAEKKIDLVETHIGKKKSQHEEMSGNLDRRFEKQTEQLAEEHTSYLRQLDSHAYEIVDKVFPEQVIGKISRKSVPAYHYLVAHHLEAARSRTESLEAGFQEAKEAIDNFLSQRGEFWTELNSQEINSYSDGWFEIPYYVIMLENAETGERRTEVVISSDQRSESSEVPEEIKELLRDAAVSDLSFASGSLVECDDQLAIAHFLENKYEVPKSECERFHADLTLSSSAGHGV